MTRSTLVPIAAAMLGLPGAALAQSAAAPANAPITRSSVTLILDGDYARLDTNKDGKLVKAEIEKGQADSIAKAKADLTAKRDAQFKKFDTNGDGQISKAEFEAAAPIKAPTVNAAPVLAKFDSNKDGAVTAAEFRTPTLTNFDKLDTNKDGQLSPAEQAKSPNGI